MTPTQKIWASLVSYVAVGALLLVGLTHLSYGPLPKSGEMKAFTDPWKPDFQLPATRPAAPKFVVVETPPVAPVVERPPLVPIAAPAVIHKHATPVPLPHAPRHHKAKRASEPEWRIAVAHKAFRRGDMATFCRQARWGRDNLTFSQKISYMGRFNEAEQSAGRKCLS